MDMLEIMKARHSVRQYEERRIEIPEREALFHLVKECNKESGMNIQIVFDESRCFDGIMAHYGKFSGVNNYIALVGKKGADLEEKSGILWREDCAEGTGAWTEYLLGCNDPREKCRRD